jgi:hypothetical protein
LLAAIHQYTADFFQNQGLEEVCSRQFDETALLAMGVIVEELVRESLGTEGHKMFLEDESRLSELVVDLGGSSLQESSGEGKVILVENPEDSDEYVGDVDEIDDSEGSD